MVTLVTRANAFVRHFSLYYYDLIILTSSEHFKHVQYSICFSTGVSCAVNRTWKACNKKTKHTFYPLRKLPNADYYYNCVVDPERW